jgi:hypothetical protein
MIWNVLVHWLSFFEHHCLQFTDSSFNHFSLPHSWSEYCSFFLLRVQCIALSCSTFQGVSKTSMSFLSRISQTQSMFFCVRCSSLFWNQLSYFKDHVYSKSSLLKRNQRCPFLKRPFENQAFWSKIQHTLFKIYSPLIVMYFENRNWPNVGLKWLFPWFFVSIWILDIGYIIWLSMMKWPLREFQKQDAQVKTQALPRKVVSLFSTYFISMHNNQ